MPRAPRLVVPGNPIHIIQRGNNRTVIFGSADDFGHYRDILCEESRRFACAIHAYVLMTNHVHLLITPEDHLGPSLLMQALGRRYVRYINARYGRTGTLWEGRFRSSLIDSERYFLTCSRYIELNPVRAQMVEDPRRYRWSSHRRNAYGKTDASITPHALYDALGSNAADRQTAYRALFDAPMRPATINAIRRAGNNGGALGSAEFLDRIATQFKRPVMRLPHGDDRRSAMFGSAGI